MKRTTLILISFIAYCVIYSQNNNVITASLGGLCSGTITKQDIIDNPEIIINTKKTDVKIYKIGLFSKNNKNYLELWTKGGHLNSQMIDRISTLNSGDELFFRIYAKDGDSTVLIHPLHFRISSNKNTTCPCYNLGLASIKEVTNGKLSKEKLISEGGLTITTNNQNIELINYKVTSVINGKKKVVTCQELSFNSEARRLIYDSKKFQRIYFSDIVVTVNGKCFYMNPIEIQLE